MKTHKKAKKKASSKSWRFNLVLPVDIAEQLNKEENKSAFVASVLKEVYEREEKERFQQELAQAYRESAEEDRKINEEWDVTTGDGL